MQICPAATWSATPNAVRAARSFVALRAVGSGGAISTTSGAPRAMPLAHLPQRTCTTCATQAAPPAQPPPLLARTQLEPSRCGDRAIARALGTFVREARNPPGRAAGEPDRGEEGA